MHINPREFRQHSARFGLRRARCEDCGRVTDPTAGVCYGCRNTDLAPIELSPHGEILTYVVQHALPEGFQTPLLIAIAETPEGGKVLGTMSEIDDPDSIDIGDPVRIEIRRTGHEDGRPLYEPRLLPAESGGDGS